ncbi:Glucose-inhibited division family A protein isoform 1 [Hibiscus syriacus]|uniref:Glucose-inhibited division family A protein isoform 1 n=1 Tax=Hibiscus syriacus TaxID=106335 RepID=A0A6A2ZXC7_HIBSY|nr:Glucose-inhibited division family A protein isoform 1 [Hibiscus syriacus]
MPEPDLAAGQTYIWTITFILFTCVVAGGGCLLSYMLTTHSDNSILIPALGFSLVCMPWIFWIMTVLYRLTSRFFGFRMVIGSLYGNDNGYADAKTSSRSGGGTMDGDDDNGDGAQIVDANGESPSNSHENNVKPGEAKNGGPMPS